MSLQGTSFAIGWKSKLKVVKELKFVKGVSVEPFASFEKESLRLDEPLVDDFMAARDYESFKRFCKEYGLIMLRDMISDVTVKRANLKGAYHTFDGRETVVSEAQLQALWTAIERRVRRLQADVNKLQQEQASEPAEFIKHLNKGLKPVRVKAIGEKEYSVNLHGAYLKAAMYLQIILAGVPLAQCEGCANVFLRTNPYRKYCSKECQASTHKQRSDQTLRRKNQVRARFYRLRDQDPERAAEIESDVLADLVEARTKKHIAEIEKQYGLEKQSPGRKPKSPAGAKLEG